jgi:nicotinate phosphoribosyltransferase
LIEMGSRRTHEEAAVASARAAHIAGFAATSNLAAGRRWGIPTTGTAAHAFTLVHDNERAAFTAQVAALGADTTLLVDTYDVRDGIRTAVEVAGRSLGAIRLDSGDLGVEARQARRQLDELGATATRIVVTSDLDEHTISNLRSAPIDGYGVGTSLVTGSGQPTAALVYKLVARETASGDWQPVAKRSVGKPSIGGRKLAGRRVERDIAIAEVIRVGQTDEPRNGERALQRRIVRAGAVVDEATLDDARRRLNASIAELPEHALELSAGDPAIELIFETSD